MHSSPVSLCKCTNCILVYAGVNCFEDRKETKEESVLQKCCCTWIFYFIQRVSFCKSCFSKKVQFRFTSPTVQIKTFKYGSDFFKSHQDSSNILRFDLDLQQTFQDTYVTTFLLKFLRAFSVHRKCQETNLIRLKTFTEAWRNLVVLNFSQDKYWIRAMAS